MMCMCVSDNNNIVLKYEEVDNYDTDNEIEDNDDDAEVVVPTEVKSVLDDVTTTTINNNWQATNKRKFENKEDVIMQKQAKYKEGKARKVYDKSILAEAKFKKKIGTQKTNTARATTPYNSYHVQYRNRNKNTAVESKNRTH